MHPFFQLLFGSCAPSRRSLSLGVMFFCISLLSVAQTLTGRVLDAKTREPLPFVNVIFDKDAYTMTDENGAFSLPARNGRLRVSIIGYETTYKSVRTSDKNVEILLPPVENVMQQAVVVGKKTKYSRKNNPAVELMRKVIEAKRHNNLKNNDYSSFQKYSKLVLALNEVTDKVFQDDKFKRLPNIREHVETCNETGKLILPLSVEENVTQEIYRRDPKTEKSIVLARRSTGVNELLNTGDIVNNMLKDCFTDVNIYDDEVRLLQYPFISPISTRNAIAFYRYFIVDSIEFRGDSVIRVDFTPNNSQDFGFNGRLYISKDSTYRVVHAEMGIPHRSDVNFVENMRIFQDFETLEGGEQVLVHDDMLIQLKIVSWLQKFQVRRTTDYSAFSFAPIPEKTFKFQGTEKIDPLAMMRTEDYWNKVRPEALTSGEDRMDLFVRRLEQIKGFKPILWIAKAFIENFVETSVNPHKPSKVDIGPVNTMITHNFIDGLRLRASAQTTANLCPHFFLRGYVAYSFKDKKWKGLAEATYSFNEKGYLPREFPVNNITFTYWRDVMSPSDRFMPTDKDNVFTSFKWTKVEHMMYFESWKLLWDREWENGLRLTLTARTEKDTPCGALLYKPLTSDFSQPTGFASLRTTDATVGLRFQPGVTWINTKQRRIPSNHDAPIFRLSHTAGAYSFAGEKTRPYNITEAGIYKRFWLASWGKIDCTLKGGVQWNRVPYPMLVMPAANLSYIKEDETFELINNMEFPTDRWASLMLSWDLNGKIFNRIPLIKKLKWREYIGVNTLWGMLSNRNNPTLARNADCNTLLYFPGYWNANPETGQMQYESLSRVMDPKKPYVEVIVGIHNIFKLLHIEYVRRLTYVEDPGVQKWGIRGMLRMTF